MSRFVLSLLAGVAALPLPALAQQTSVEPSPEAAYEEEDAAYEEGLIVVTGQRERGSVLGDIEPEVQLRPGDIRSLGVSNIGELLEELAPQTRSSRGRGGGRPVILLNGRRISSFREIRGLPPEAVVRVDVLPEEVALKYGYPAEQRVVNFVLRENFRAVTAEAEQGFATAGGRSDSEADVSIVGIDGTSRWNVEAEYNRETALLESERDLVGDLGRFRTLLPATDQLSLNGTYSRNVLGDVAASANASFEATQNESRVGMDEIELGPLRRESDSRNAHLGLAFNGELQPWQWSLTANYDRDTVDTLTERDGGARDEARSTTDAGTTEFVVNGPIVELPAGDLSASLKAGGEIRGFSSETLRAGVAQQRELSRNIADAQASFDLPIASRRRGVLDEIGDLSANLNLAARHLSDFGTLATLGGGLNWSPIEDVDLIASFTSEDGAPSMQQLGDPLLVTPNVPVFDFTTGETVEVTRITGGNAALVADNRRVLKLGATIEPLDDLTLRIDYTKSRIRDAISAFPAITPEIEAAFPDRFERNADGRLVRIDTRPVNFARVDTEELRWGVNFSKRLGPERRERRGQGAGERPRGEGAGERPRGFGRFGGGRRGGRLRVSLYHTWRLEDSVLIRPGVPELDFLNGSAAGNSGGRPRHEIELRGSLFKNGFGGRLSANWQSGTFVRGGPDGAGGTASDLRFSDLATVDLRLFANLGDRRDLVRNHPWFRGTRISLDIDNVFDSRIEVRDETGATPFSYQPAFLDPLGRTVSLSFRKLFF